MGAPGGGSAQAGGGGPQPQALGAAPKNARLAMALLQHRNARPRPKGWLMGVVESVHKEGEAGIGRQLGLPGTCGVERVGGLSWAQRRGRVTKERKKDLRPSIGVR
jgi:hypothetical protein